MTEPTQPTQPARPRTYRITWNKTESHNADVTAKQLAELLGLDSPDDIDPTDPLGNAKRDLDESLAELEEEGDTYDGETVREDIEVTR